MRQVLAIDIDGVLANFNQGFAEGVKYLWNIDIELPPRVWDYFKQYLTDEQLSTTWDAIHASDVWWEQLKPLPGAKDFLNNLSCYTTDEVYDGIYFVTNRPVGQRVRKQTSSWLFRNGFPGAHVIIAPKGKYDLYRGLGTTFVLDDKWENCQDAIVARTPKVLMLSAPLNEKYHPKAIDIGINIVSSLEEAWQVITTL